MCEKMALNSAKRNVLWRKRALLWIAVWHTSPQCLWITFVSKRITYNSHSNLLKLVQLLKSLSVLSKRPLRRGKLSTGMWITPKSASESHFYRPEAGFQRCLVLRPTLLISSTQKSLLRGRVQRVSRCRRTYFSRFLCRD